ncbi:MbeD/MobD family mobilization/exclusion protein [Pantoea stewartii]|uniref:MbeD/MobD family mobilization/exclusion protein n=1 Tax=Pantoea stewartii TaxID=66269 RepID=UPI003DA715C7
MDEWENAFAEWRTMSGLNTTGERGAERGASRTSRHVQRLTERCAGCREDEQDRGAPELGALSTASESAGAGTIAAATDV